MPIDGKALIAVETKPSRYPVVTKRFLDFCGGGAFGGDGLRSKLLGICQC